MCSLTVMEARHPKSRCLWAMLLPKVLGKNSSLSLLASGSCWQFLMFLDSWQYNYNLCLLHYMAIFSVCLHMAFLQGHQSLGLGTTLTQYDLILLNLITAIKIPFPNKSHSQLQGSRTSAYTQKERALSRGFVF